jgi:hypothetical protein
MHGFRVEIVVTQTNLGAHLAQDDWHAVTEGVHAIQEMADAFNDGRLREGAVLPDAPTLADLAGGLALGLAHATPQKRPRRVTRGTGRKK